jgi:acetyltransferase EpsM
MPKRVVILGGLGNGSVVAAAIEDGLRRGDFEWEIAGYLNDRLERGSQIEGYPVLGGLDTVPRLLEEQYYFINTIYRIDGQDARIALFEGLGIPETRLATVIHPTVYLPANVKVGSGTVLMPGVAVSPGVTLGRCNLVMASATIGHNTEIGDHCHFAAQSCVGAYLHIGWGVHIGLNASVREELHLGECSTLGMGSVLLKNMEPYEVWAGVPAKRIRLARKEIEG